jgi:hypothetical protein
MKGCDADGNRSIQPIRGQLTWGCAGPAPGAA